MPLAQDIYETLVKDPDLEIGSHQTREEAAETEATFRARQHLNNIKALSLATEPVKKESSIDALMNYVSSFTKAFITGGLTFLQKIEKGGLGGILAGHGKSAKDKLFAKNPLVMKTLAKFDQKGKDFFQALLDSGVPAPNVVDMLNNIHSALSNEDAVGSIDWIPDMVDEIFKPNSELAASYGMEPSHLHAFHAQVQNQFPGIVTDLPGFKPESYHPDKQDFYGSNTKKQLTQQATIENVNKALEKMGFPHKLALGGQDKIKFVNKDGSDVADDAYHNPFAGERKGGRLYESHIDGKDPDSSTPNIVGSKLSNHSIADILNAIHHNVNHPEASTPPTGTLEEDPNAPPVPTPDVPTEEEVAKKAEEELGKAKKYEEDVIKKNPPKKPNTAGNTPQGAKEVGKKAKSMPHVVFGAWGGPQHGVGFGGVQAPHHIAHSLAMQHGICNHLGQINKAGMTLLQSAYDSGVLRKKHVQIKDTHCILHIDGIMALLEHHGIDVNKGNVLGKDVASEIAGQELASDMMPEGIDWEELAKKLSDPIPTGGAGDIPQGIIEAAEEETGEPAEVPTTPDNYEAKAQAHAARLNAAYDGMGVDDMDLAALEKALGNIQNMWNTIPEEHMQAAVDALVSYVNPTHMPKFLDYLNSPDGGLMHPSIKEGIKKFLDDSIVEPPSDDFPEPPSEAESDKGTFKTVLDKYLKELTNAKNKQEHDNAMEKIKSLVENNPMKEHGFSGKEINEAIRDVVGKHTNNPAGFMEHHGFPHGQHYGMSPANMAKAGISPTPFTPSKTPWAGTPEDQHGKVSKKLVALAKIHAKHKADALKFPELKHIADDSQEELHGAIKEGIKDGSITHAGIKDALGKGLAGSPHLEEVMGELPSDVKEGIDAAPIDSTPQPTPTPEEQEAAMEPEDEAVEAEPPIEPTPEEEVEPEDEDVEEEPPIEPTEEEDPTDVPEEEDPTDIPEGEDEATEPTTPTDVPEEEDKPSEEEKKPPVEEKKPAPVEPPKEVGPDPAKEAIKKEKVMAALFGDDWEDDEDAQTYSEFLDENPKELASAYKQHVIQPIANKKMQEAKEQKAKEVAEEKQKVKAEEKQAKEDAKAKKSDANVLPSEPGDLDAMVADSEDENVGEAMASQHARELMAHMVNHKDDMGPETRKKLVEALHECKKHGADFDALMKEKDELGENFGTPEHLKQAREDAAKKAELHENHKQLTAHDSEDQSVKDAQTEAYESGKHNKFSEIDENGKPIKEEGEEDEPSKVKHNLLHSLDPMQQKLVEDMKKAKASGDEEGYQKAAKALEDTGIPMKDSTHSGDDAPKTGPPDPEVAKKKMAEGYVWHEETRNWILKETLKELEGHSTSGGGGGASLVNGDYGGAASHGKTKFNTQTGEPNSKPFAVHEDGATPSPNKFMHNSNGLHAVGDGKPPTGGAASHGDVNANVLGGKLAADGHMDNHGKSKNGISRLPTNFGHPADASKTGMPKTLGQQAKAGFKSGIATALANKKSGTPFLEGLKGKFFGKGYPMPEGVALAAFLKQYGTHDHLKDKSSVHNLLERLEAEEDETQDDKSLQESIIR